MRPHSPATRVALRGAVWASVAIHLVAAGAFLALLRTGEQKSREAAIDTRAPHVRMSLTEEVVSVEVTPQPAPANTAPETVPTKPTPEVGVAQTAPPTPEAVPTVVAPSLPARPFAPSVPRTLPPELVAMIRKPVASGPPIPMHDPNVKPAGSAPGRPATRSARCTAR